MIRALGSISLPQAVGTPTHNRAASRDRAYVAPTGRDGLVSDQWAAALRDGDGVRRPLFIQGLTLIWALGLIWRRPLFIQGLTLIWALGLIWRRPLCIQGLTLIWALGLIWRRPLCIQGLTLIWALGLIWRRPWFPVWGGRILLRGDDICGRDLRLVG